MTSTEALPLLLPSSFLPPSQTYSQSQSQAQSQYQAQSHGQSRSQYQSKANTHGLGNGLGNGNIVIPPHKSWRPKKFLSSPQPPPQDENAASKLAELQNSLGGMGIGGGGGGFAAGGGMGAGGGPGGGGVNPALLDGKILKKTRPRRTVDYNGGLGRLMLLRKLRPNPTYVPQLRPCPPSIIDVLLPKAYPENPSTSLCTKFVHTSTNKIRTAIHVVIWTPESRRILTGSTSGEFTLWNGLTFNFETILQAHDNAICTMTFNHSGSYLASADKGGIIKYFEPNMNNLTAFNGSNAKEAVRGLSFSPDDKRFVTGSDDSSVRVWDFERREVEGVLEGHGWDVKCVQWHPTKGLIVSGGKDNQIKFWDPRTGTALSTLHTHKNAVQAVAWSPNGNLLASASRDQTVRVFDIRAMKEFRILKGHKKEVCSIAWHPVHPLLTSGGSEGSILHWDLSTPDDVLPTSSSPFTTSSLTSNSTALPTGGTTTIAPIATLSEAHDSNVWSLVFHPFGHILVSASNDYTTRFWSRERPGDVEASLGVGGEKPPQGGYGDGGDEGDEDEGGMVPGLNFAMGPGGGGGGGSGGSGGGAGGGWGYNGREEADYSNANGPGGQRFGEDEYEGFNIPGFASDARQTQSREYPSMDREREREFGRDHRERDSYRDREFREGRGGGGGGGGGGGRGEWRENTRDAHRDRDGMRERERDWDVDERDTRDRGDRDRDWGRGGGGGGGGGGRGSGRYGGGAGGGGGGGGGRRGGGGGRY